MKTTFADRFWNRVNIGLPTECWEWIGAKVKKSYSGGTQRGIVWFNGHRVSASRAAYILTNNVKLGRLDFVCHTCDNGNCCNPDHLYVGSVITNNQDAFARQRNKIRKGEETPIHKLTEKEVLEIRSKYVYKIYTMSMLAKDYGVSWGCVRDIIKRRNWKYI